MKRERALRVDDHGGHVYERMAAFRRMEPGEAGLSRRDRSMGADCAKPPTHNLHGMSDTVDHRHGIDLDARTIAGVAHDIPGLVGDLRSDHAGETGAVAIYLGILALARDPQVRQFARRHLATEREHLARFDDLLPPNQRSALLPIWRVAGWLTGALPAAFGADAVYATIDAVETFVDHHYEEQIRKLPADGPGGALRALLISCQADEVHHRDEARIAHAGAAGPATRGWQWLVGTGSALAVAAARRV